MRAARCSPCPSPAELTIPVLQALLALSQGSGSFSGKAAHVSLANSPAEINPGGRVSSAVGVAGGLKAGEAVSSVNISLHEAIANN